MYYQQAKNTKEYAAVKRQYDVRVNAEIEDIAYGEMLASGWGERASLYDLATKD